MDVLVIGGSVFVGRAVVDEALAAGHDVTVFNRGVSGVPPPAGSTHVIGDRTVAADLEQLRGREFDLVVDTCGYVPADVSKAAEILKDRVDFYSFVSTINAFSGWPSAPDYRAGGLHDSFPDDPMVVIDSRDLALHALGRRPGACEITGPPGRDTREELLAACAEATGSDATVTWVESGWLGEQGVTPWVEVPLWIPPAEAPSLFDHRPPDDLTTRPLIDTVTDTWTWQRAVPGGWHPSDVAPGLTSQRERDLLAAWHGR